MKNTPLRAIIVDDELMSRQMIARVLGKYCPQVELLASAGSVEEAYSLVVELQPNLLLLDIEMPHGSGFELLQKLNRTDFEVIFITGFDQYALRAIKFHALDYLLKPLDVVQLIDAIQEAEKRVQGKLDQERLQKLLANLNNNTLASHQLAISTLEGREFIPIDQIIYCRADGGYTEFHLSNGRQLVSSKNLGEYEKLLPEALPNYQNCFFRIHHSYLINLTYINK